MSNRTRPARSASAGPNPMLIGAVVVGVLLLAVFAVVFASRDNGDSGTNVATDEATLANEYGAVTVDGQPLAPMADGSADPAVGQQAPAVLSERAAGSAELQPAQGDKPTVVAFLAHWCPHCQRELPLLVDLAQQGAFDQVNLVAVLTGTSPDRPNFPPSAWIEKENWPGTVLYDDQQSTAAAAYGLSSYPYILFLDADGNVVSRITGEQPADVITSHVAEITGS